MSDNIRKTFYDNESGRPQHPDKKETKRPRKAKAEKPQPIIGSVK